MQPLSGNQRPDLLTSLMNVSFVLRLPRKMHLCRSSSMPAIVFGNATKPSRFAHFWRGAQSLAPATRNDIWTSKSGPNPLCFVHFDLEMCFAPQRRALFRHLNFQKWSERAVFCTCWLQNVLRATTACTFSTSQLPKVVRPWCVLYILTSKCASRHNGVHFFDIWPAGSAPAALASLLFDPPEPQIVGKTQCFATFLPFHASASAFFWIFLFSDLLSSDLSLLSASALLCFSSVHIVGSLTSKLPSIIHTHDLLYRCECVCDWRYAQVVIFTTDAVWCTNPKRSQDIPNPGLARWSCFGRGIAWWKFTKAFHRLPGQGLTKLRERKRKMFSKILNVWVSCWTFWVISSV